MTSHAQLKTVRAALLGLALLFGTGVPAVAQDAAAATPRAAEQGPALWVVSDEDSTLYLFGTIHMLRPTTRWDTPRVTAAFDSASRLVMEVADLEDPAVVLPLVRQYGISPELPLSGLLTPSEMEALDAAARLMGGSAARMDSMRPWLAGVTIASASVIRAGYDVESGVERVLKARAEAAGMSVGGLETADEQIRMLAGFPEEGQLAYLRRALDEFETAAVEVDRLADFWATGDMDGIETLSIDPMRERSELLYQALLVRRNTNWADQIQTMLEGSGTVFIAVGALHLTGDDSVQKILQARGVAVEAAPR